MDELQKRVKLLERVAEVAFALRNAQHLDEHQALEKELDDALLKLVEHYDLSGEMSTIIRSDGASA
jgi:hypothetical protein